MEIISDFTASIIKSFDEIDSRWRAYDGLVVAGTHSPHDVEEMIDKIRDARETGRPFYGECYGHQLAVIEYARHVLGIADATSEEFGKGTFVIQKRKEGLKVGLHEGESWWNNYEAVPGILARWIKPDHFITVQYHPSYQSSKEKPHPVLVHFLELCRSCNCKKYNKIINYAEVVL